MVRAKFRVTRVTRYAGVEGAEIALSPVTSGSEENKAFWKYTPNGELKMGITNPDAVDAFDLGAEYYLDFTPAPKEAQ